MPSTYTALISDIDGTLTPLTPNALPSPKVTAVVQEAVVQGLTFCLASGRPYRLVKYLIDHLGNTGPCIVDNGAAIIDSKTEAVLWEANLTTKTAQGILEMSRKFTLVRTSCDIGGFDSPKQIPTDAKVRKISIHDIPLEVGDDLITKVTAKFHDITGIKAASYESEDLVDVYFSHVNATKQYAIVKLSEILDIPTEKMIGIGDGYNDFPLLMACGLKVAMGNAIPDLKAVADVEAPPVNQDGLATIIEEYYLKN